MSKGKIEFLRGDRASNNESEAKGMFGCFAIDGVVIAYVPSLFTALRLGRLLGVGESDIERQRHELSHD